MSLTEDIAELVDSANHLTDEVSGKIAEIDQKNEEFINSFDDNLASALSTTIYMDGDKGDNNNNGSAQSPIKSFAGLKGKMRNAGFYDIFIRGSVELDISFGCNNSTVLFRRWGDEKPEIKQIIYEIVDNDDGTKSGYAGHFSMRNSYLYFKDIKIYTAVEDGYSISSWYAFFSRNDQTYGQVTLYRCKLFLNDVSFMHTATGPDIKNLALYGVQITQNGAGYLIYSEDGYIITKAVNITVHGDINFSDLYQGIKYDANGIAYNVLTNSSNLARSSN